MGNLLAYSLTASVIIIVMHSIYRATLSQTTLHGFNRAILLSIYAIALSALPVMQIVANADGDVTLGHLTATAIATPADHSPTTTASIPWLTYILWIYIAGCAIMIARLLLTLAGIAILIVTSTRQRIGRYTLVLHNRPRLVPFSWGRWIVMRHSDNDTTAHITIAHETAHLDQRHWLDLLLAELTIILTWYNPASWLLRDELQNIHEFAADRQVILRGINAQEYQLFLIKKTVGDRFQALTNSLNHSSLKKRITMMLSNKSRGKARMRALALVPAVALSVILVNNPAVASVLGSLASTPATIEVSTDKDTKNSTSATNRSESKVYTAAEEMPRYPMGEAALMKHISDNVKWPEGADKNASGFVVMQFTISETGKVTDPEVLRNTLGEAFGQEAIRVINTIPDFIPGRIDGKPVAVKYTLPIRFTAKK